MPPQIAFQQTSQTSWTRTAYNFITGKVCQNWENTALMAMSIAKVFFAAYSMIFGSFLFGLFLLGSAAIDAIAVRKLKNFASWNKNLKETHRQNDLYAKNNFVMRSHLTTLEAHLAEQERLNQTYAETTQWQSDLTAELAISTAANGKLTTTLDEMIRRSHGSQRDILVEFRDQITQLAGANKVIQEVSAQMHEGHEEHLAEVRRTVREFKQLNAEDFQQREELRGDLTRLNAELGSKTEALQIVLDGLRDTGALVGDNAQQAQRILGQIERITAGVAGEPVPGAGFPMPGNVRHPGEVRA